MKKVISIAMLVFGICTVTNSQELKFGAKAGVNLATLQPDFNDPKTRTSFHLGGMVEVLLTDTFSVQPELLYSGQGVKDQSDDDEVRKYDYLLLPVMAKYYVTEGLSVETGPQLGILLSAKLEDDGTTTDQKDLLKSTDLGVALGLEYRLQNGLNFGLRYFFGGDIDDVNEELEAKNRVFQLSIGYFFN